MPVSQKQAPVPLSPRLGDDKPSGPALRERYTEIRGATERLCAPLTPEDCTVQSMDDASPVKWHLAHTSWFFETFVLEQRISDYRPFHPRYRVLFNSYYNLVGKQHPRPRRGMLTRPTLAEIMAYRKHVDDHILSLDLEAEGQHTDLAELIETGVQHEQQHQELILMDIKHLLSCNPLAPAYQHQPGPPKLDAAPLKWFAYPEGLWWIGHDDQGFAFDNETPRHRVFSQAYELASRLVTNGEYLSFIEDGGYSRPALWLSDGWATVQRQGWQAPLYWWQQDGVWHEITLSGLREIDLSTPVCHISLFEADAYARWSDARLPTEFEWESAARAHRISGNFVEQGYLHPCPLTADHGSDGPHQLFGDVWEWTQSAYLPYPGFKPPKGALGEYNGKFMSGQMVLRGGSCVTPGSHIRASYRNFFYPMQRWQFAGIRLARDLA